MTRSYRLAAAAAIALACSTFVACSASVSVGSDNLDTKKLERSITSALEDGNDGKVTSIDCPKEKSKKGNTFTCTFESDTGVSGEVDVKVTNNDGDVTYKTNSDSLKIKGDTIATAVADDFKSKYPDQAEALSGVDCGDSISGTPGATGTCAISSTDGQSADLTITIDAQGAATWNFTEITG